MSFVTDAELRNEIASRLKVDGVDLSDADWVPNVSSSNKAAYADIIGALLARGYTAAQIATWDARKTFQLHQGMFWALYGAKGADDPDSERWAKFDRREELKTVALVAGGVIITDPAKAGAVSYGTLNTDADRYVRDTYSLGEKTKDGWPKW